LQDQGEVPYMSINIDLDQYEPFDLNKDYLMSPLHITPINPEIKGMDTTPSMIIAKILHQRACNL
jgi:hypothetical protein